MRRLFRPVLLVVGIAALTAVMGWGIDRGPFARTPVGVEGAYWKGAGLAKEGKLPPAARSQYPSPLYPLLLAPLTGDTSAAGARRTLTLITLPLLALAVYGLARRRAGPWPAAIAAWISVILAPIALEAGTFTPAVPATALALGALVVLEARRAWWTWALAGLAIGVALRFQSVLGWALAALLLIAAVVRPGTSRRAFAAVAFAAALVVSIAAVRLADPAERTVPPVSGIDFYRGHRARASGVSPRRGDRDELRWWTPAEYLREASRAAGRKLTVREAGEYWTRKGVAELASHPLAEARREGIRFLALYGGEPIPRTVGITYLLDQGEGMVLPASVWAARILLPLGFVGLVAGRRRLGAPMVVAALGGFAAATITFAEADFRLLAATATAAGLAFGIRATRDASGRGRLALAGGSLAAIAVLGVWPALGAVPGHGVRAEDHVDLGLLFDQEGRGSAAIREYERALSLDPDDPYPPLAIAALLSRDNAIPEAINELEPLRRRHPDSVPTLLWLTRLYQAQQRWMEAAAVYTDLIRLEPWEPEHYNNLGTMYVQMGFFDQAVSALRAALDVDSTYATARENLQGLQQQGLAPGMPVGADSLRAAQEKVLAHLRLGDTPGAEAAMDSAYARFGRNEPVLQYMDGTLQLMAGQPEKAIRLLEEAKKTMPENAILLNNLGTAYVHANRYRDAEKAFIDVLRLQPSNQPAQRSLNSVRAVLDSLATSGKKP